MQILFILLSLFSTTLCAQAAFNAPEVDAIAYDVVIIHSSRN